MEPTHRLAVQVALLIPRRHPDSSRSKSDKIPRLDHPLRPRCATGPRSWPLTDGSCGFHSGLISVGSVSFWPSCPSAELPLEHTDLPRSRGHGFEEVLRHPGGRRSRVASTRSALGPLVRLHQLAEEPHQDPVLGQHGLVALCQTSGGRDAGMAGVTDSVDRTLKRGADTAAQRHRFVEDASPSMAPAEPTKRVCSTR